LRSLQCRRKLSGLQIQAGILKIFVDWLASSEGQQAIDAFRLNGQKLFNPSAAWPRKSASIAARAPPSSPCEPGGAYCTGSGLGLRFLGDSLGSRNRNEASLFEPEKPDRQLPQVVSFVPDR
jgi:hypothetical protein